MNNVSRKPGTLKRTGGTRNVHGTRVRRRIECSHCGSIDYVSVKPTKEREVFCRKCAVKHLNAYEMGVSAPVPTRNLVCEQCQVEFSLPKKVLLTRDKILCDNCSRGFEVWRGSNTLSPQDRQQMVVQTRVSGTLLRKRSGSGVAKTASMG